MNKHRWTEEEKQFLNSNYPTKGAQYCADKLSLRVEQIRATVNRLKIVVTKDRKSKVQRMRATRPRPELCGVPANTFLECKTPEAAYVLGFIWADGCLLKTKGDRITVEITHDDWVELHDVFMKTGKWVTAHRTRSNRRPQSSFITTNKSLFTYLKENDYVEKSYKSADKILSCLPDNLKPLWFRGFFDGDGGFYIKSGKYCQMSFAGSYEQDWSFLTNLLNNLGLNYKITQHIYKANKYSVVRSSSRHDVKIFGKYIYNEFDNIGLGRKYNKWINLFRDDLLS